MPRSSSLVSIDPDLIHLCPLHPRSLAGHSELVDPVPSKVWHPDLSSLAGHVDLDDLVRVRRVLAGKVAKRRRSWVERELIDDGLVVGDDEAVRLERNQNA
jgi:hypothetical protein